MGQNILRPQHHLSIARIASETDALIDQRPADPQASRGALDIQQPQLPDIVARMCALALRTGPEPFAPRT